MSIATVQTKSAGTVANAATLSAVLDAAPTVGNLLVCAAGSDATLTMTSAGWTLVDSNVNFTGLCLWAKIAGASESSTVTVAPSASVSVEMIVTELAGNITSSLASCLDKHANANGADTGTTDETTQADEIAIAVVGITGTAEASTPTWTNGFTHATSVFGAGSSGTSIALATKTLSATGAVSSAPSDLLGSASGAIVATFKAAADADTAPANTVAPAVTGTAHIGETLTTDNGTWDPAPDTYAYQWSATGGEITGATAATYEILGDDVEVGDEVWCTVIATNDVGDSDPAASNHVTVEAIPALTFTLRFTGGAANSAPGASIGGAESSEAYGSDTDLFDDITGEQAEAGQIDYRCVVVHNDDTGDAAVVAFITGQLDGALGIAVGAAAEEIGETIEQVDDDETAPTGVTFDTPTTAETGIDLGTITAGDGRGLWVRRTIPASTAADPTNPWEITLQVTPL